MLYPLKFSPILKTKIWGGERIYQFYRHQSTEKKAVSVGESWEVSAVSGDESVVINGYLAENTLEELLEVYMGELVGDDVYTKHGIDFPLLVKIIDARDRLSLQVHPNDELAAKRGLGRGKTELWYVLDAEPESYITAGFTEKLEKDSFLKHIEDNTLDSTLHKYKVEKGDMFFVPAGCVHSIGAGCLILEIQQSSDITYRIYDYNRLQDNGLPRELHTELALDAIDFDSNAVIKITPKLLSDGVYKAVNSKYFNVNIRHINGDDYLDVSDKDSFVILSCVEGALHYTYKDMEDTLMEGETILLPAIIEGITLQTEKQSKLIEIFISDKDNN